jgi:hypothetical protein
MTPMNRVMAASLIPGAILLALSGCAAHSKLQPTAGAVVRDWARPAQFPAWIDGGAGVKDGRFGFIGVVDRAAREDFARTDARENARVALARDLANRIQAEYGTAREGVETQFVHDVATTVADATVRGAMPAAWYTERYHVQPDPGAPITAAFYKVWVRMEMSVEDFRTAKAHALETVAKTVRDEEGRRMYEDLRQRAASPEWPYRSQ